MPLSKLSVSDLKQDAIQLFKDKAVKRGRLTKEEVSVEDTILMDNLHLIDEDGYLIRAAMLAFYKDPEKWVTGSYIKIGYFGKSDSDLVYQDEVHGPLIEQVDKTVDLVYTKYMKALIDYEGVQRIEQFMFHKDAFREILLNAIVHKDSVLSDGSRRGIKHIRCHENERNILWWKSSGKDVGISIDPSYDLFCQNWR